MIILPKGAVIVKRDTTKEKSIIIGVEEEIKNTGTVIFTAPELTEFQFLKIKFRENFTESIDVKGYKNLLFLRDLNSSMYYITKK